MARAANPVRDEMQELIRKGEEGVAEVRTRWMQTLAELVPGDGAAIRKVVNDAFDMTERLLKSQREVTMAMLDRVLGELPKPAHRPVAVKRAPAHKPAAKPVARKRARAA